MQWEALLSAFRFGGPEEMPYDETRYPIGEFEKDYNKIITSASFRRLQDKTQVFPLEKSDFVRTRLTHSIEVSSLAKRIGSMVIRNIAAFQQDSGYTLTGEQASSILDILTCAGLLHDLGNPSFGHFGEVILSDWFTRHFQDPAFTYKGKAIGTWLTPSMQADLQNFEGNAQTLRILTKLHPSFHTSGMNLTAAVLNTLVKYPTDSCHFDKHHSNNKFHKLGYYTAETAQLTAIAAQTGTVIQGEMVRHPLAYILEAADDIAYATADLEDAHKKKLFSLQEFMGYYRSRLAYYASDMTEKQKEKSTSLVEELERQIAICPSEQTAFQNWVEYARHWLAYSAAYGFTSQENYGAIMEGTYTHSILQDTFHQFSMEILQKDIPSVFIFSNSSIVKLELAAQTILSALLDRFVPAIFYLDETAGPFCQTKGDKKLTSLISDNYLRSYWNQRRGVESYDLYLRLLLVTDYISGMTDSYAKDLYQILQGIY